MLHSCLASSSASIVDRSQHFFSVDETGGNGEIGWDDGTVHRFSTSVVSAGVDCSMVKEPE